MLGIPVEFTVKQVKYEPKKEGKEDKDRGACSIIIDKVEAAYQIIDPELKVHVESEEVAKRTGFLYATADILQRVMNVDLFKERRILRDFTVNLDPVSHQVYLTVEKLLFNATLIEHIDAKNEAKGLREAASAVDNFLIEDQFVLLREVFCRLLAIALSEQALVKPDKEAQDILTILNKLAQDLNTAGVTYVKGGFFGNEKKTTAFTFMMKSLAEPLGQVKQVIEANSILKANTIAIHTAIRYVNTAKRIVRSQMVGLLCYEKGLDLTPPMLKAHMLESTFDVKHREFTKKSQKDKNVRFPKAYLQYNNVLQELETLGELFKQLSIASHVGGWTFWWMNVIDIHLLVEEINKVHAKIKAIGKEVETPEYIASSPVGTTLNDNNAWVTNVELDNLSVSTSQRLMRLQDPEVLHTLLEINQGALAKLVDLHSGTRFKFINSEALRMLPGGQMFVDSMKRDNETGERYIDVTDDAFIQRIANETIEAASLKHFGKNNAKIMSTIGLKQADYARDVISDLKFFIHQALTSRKGNRVREAEQGFFAGRIASLLAEKMLYKYDGGSDNMGLAVVDHCFNEGVAKDCINAVIADLAEQKETRAAFALSTAGVDRVRMTFDVAYEDSMYARFAYDYVPHKSSIGLIDLPNTGKPGTPYEQVKKAIEFHHDREMQERIIKLIGSEIFNLLKEKPDSSIFCRFRVEFPEIFEKYKAHREEAKRGGPTDSSMPHSKWMENLGMQLKEIEALCLQEHVVHRFVSVELEKEGRYTVAFLKAWAMVNNINLTIFQDMGRTKDGRHKPPLIAEPPRDPHSPQQYYVLAETPYSFRTVHMISAPQKRQERDDVVEEETRYVYGGSRSTGHSPAEKKGGGAANELRRSSYSPGKPASGYTTPVDGSNAQKLDLFGQFATSSGSKSSSPKDGKPGVVRRTHSNRSGPATSDMLTSAVTGLEAVLRRSSSGGHGQTLLPSSQKLPGADDQQVEEGGALNYRNVQRGVFH